MMMNQQSRSDQVTQLAIRAKTCRDAFNELAVRTSRFISARLKLGQDTEDVTQQYMVERFSNHVQSFNRGNWYSYLLQRLKWFIKDFYRRAHNHRACNFKYRSGRQLSSISSNLPAFSVATGSRVQLEVGDLIASHYRTESEQREALTDHLSDDLTAMQRNIVVLYYFNGLTMREIGRQVGLSEGRVSQLHSEAIDQMRAERGLPV